MGYGPNELREDLTAKADSLNGRKRQEFLARLLAYKEEGMQLTREDEVGNALQDVIKEWLEDYFMPRGEDGKLKKGLFEERLRDFTDFCVERQLEAGSYLDGLGPHGADWKQKYLIDHVPDSPDVYALGNLGELFTFGKHTLQMFDEAYEGKDLKVMINEVRNASIQNRLQNATWDEKRALKNGQRLFQGDAIEETAQEKTVRKQEAPYGEPRNYAQSFAKYTEQLDFSFIRDKDVAMTLRSKQPENKKTPVRSLSDRLGEIEEALNSRENSRWRGDSGYMKDVKKGLQHVRELIEVQGTGTPESRAAIAEAYQKLQKSCQVYLEHRSGKRMTPAGTRRQQAILNLSQFLGEDTSVQEMMEADRREAEAKKGPVPGTEMAKLLVMSETGASFQQVQDPEAFKTQKEAALARIRQGMEQMGQDKSAMTEIVGTCSRALASIDVRRETLKALGQDPDSLSREQMETVLKAPENHDKINDFLYHMSNTVKAASGELNSHALQEVRSQMEQDGKGKSTLESGRAAAKALTEGLEPEVQWYQMRKDYENGLAYENPQVGISYLTNEERTAQRNALNPGRQKLIQGEMQREMKAEGASQEQHRGAKRMDFNDLNREFQNEQAQTGRKRSLSNPGRHPQLEHPESSKERHSLGK